jgi:hypothetical protein
MYGGHMYGKLDLGSTIPEYVEIVMEPSNIMHIRLPDGRSMQTALPNYMTTGKHKIGIYSVAKEKNLPAKMALKSITLKKVPFSHSYLSNLKDNEKKIVLFAGNLGDIWLPYNGNGGNFSKYASFVKNELVVDVPKGNKWGETGIVSSNPVVWLDKLGKDGEIKIKVDFDSIKMTGFSIFAGDINKNGNVPWIDFVRLDFLKDKVNHISKLRFKIRNKLLFDENITEDTPSSITLSFKNGEVDIKGDTFKKKTVKWPYSVEGRALYVWVTSHAPKYDQAAKMVLKKIVLEREFGKPLPLPKPAKGVDPLHIKTIYENGLQNKWECFEANLKDKKSNCTLKASNLVISISKNGESLWGIRSKDKIITLDSRRIDVTSLKMTLYFNPKKTDSFYIGLDKYHVILEKKNEKTYLFKWGNSLSREVDAEWLKNEWNGKVNIVMAKNYTKIGLDEGTAIHLNDRISREPSLSILAAPLKRKMKHGANLELKKITTQWLVPDGMTAVDRWELIADENFNPDEFLNELREGK